VNNLKQLGLAMLNYASAIGTLPEGTTNAPWNVPGQLENWSAWSAQALMLPYLEQKPIYDSINFSWGSGGHGATPPTTSQAINTTAYNTKIASFLCPSDGQAGKSNINSYHCSQGTSTFNNSTKMSGLFAYKTAYTLADITDGTSNTVAFSEALVGDENGQADKLGNSTGQDVKGGAAGNLFDVTGNLAKVQQDIATCTTTWADPKNRVSGRVGPGARLAPTSSIPSYPLTAAARSSGVPAVWTAASTPFMTTTPPRPATTAVVSTSPWPTGA
jgi:hypothetical protein